MKKILLSSLLIPGIALAADETELETVNVTAKGFQNSMTTSLRDFDVIEIGDLESQYASLADLLSDVSGVHATVLTNRAQHQNFSIEGLSLDKTLVLLNGKKIGSATLGEASIQNIPVAQIERVEIMKGSGTVLYGAAAMAGVINIITKADQRTEVSASAATQENVSTTFQHSQSLNNLIDTGLTWTYERATGTTAREGEWTGFSSSGVYDDDDDGFENHALNAYANIQATKDIKIKNSYFRTTGTYDYDADSGGDDQATFKNTQLVSEVDYSKGQVSANVKASRQSDISVSYGVENSRKDAERIATISDSIHAQTLYQADSFEVLAGAEWQNDYVGNSEKQYDKENIVNKSNYAITTYNFENVIKLSAGSRRDTTNAYGTHLTYNVSAQAVKDQHSVTISQQSGYQTPTFNDLYWPNAGNPDLQPEISKSKFVKYEFTTAKTAIGIKLLRHDIADQIAWAPDSENNWKPSNINSSTIEGTRLSWNQNWTESISTQVGTEKTIAINNEDNGKLALVPEYESSIKVSYRGNRLSTFAKANYVGVRLDSKRTETLMPYTTYDLGVSGSPARNLTLSLLGSNILDREYTPNSSYVSEPLTIKGTASYQF